MIEIILTKGYSAIIDESDFDLVSQHIWHVKIGKYTNYAMTNIKDGNGKSTTLAMHRLLFPDCEVVDHIDKNGLNNQRHNLRPSTYSENNTSREWKNPGVSKYKGVSWDKKANKWIVQIQKDKIHYNLGRYENEEVAAIVYNKHAMQLHSKFAHLNKIYI